MEILAQPISDDLVTTRIDDLATRYARAGNPVIQILNLAGGQSDALIDRLPEGLRENLVAGTEQALKIAMKAAKGSRGVVGDQPTWLTQAVTTAMGAAGGFGGLPTALAELPVTTTIFLHGIQTVAAQNGFDPTEESVQFDCVQVFAAAGPLEHDDDADLAFLTTRALVYRSGAAGIIDSRCPASGGGSGPKACRANRAGLRSSCGGSNQLRLCRVLPRDGACAFRIATARRRGRPRYGRADGCAAGAA